MRQRQELGEDGETGDMRRDTGDIELYNVRQEMASSTSLTSCMENLALLNVAAEER